MNNRSVALIAVVFGGFFLLFVLFLGLAFTQLKSSGETHAVHHGKVGPKIGVVELEGVIGEERGIKGSPEAEQIRDFAEDDEIEAILIRIDSPGGAVAPSQEIHEEILRARKKKHVVCSMGQVAASGGFYIAVACEKIVANKGTMTGSIGVISQFFAAPELVEMAKVQHTTLKTGALKDSGSPFREFNDQDRAYFEGMLNKIYEQFLGAVAEGRSKKVEEVRPYADGRVFTGEEAQALGFVDKLGNFRTAIEELMTVAELKGEPNLVYPSEENEFPFLKLLRNEARTAAGEVARGAIEGATAKAGVHRGVQLLAPGLVP